MPVLVIDYSWMLMVLASDETSNLLNQTPTDGCVRISVGSYVEHSGIGYDTCSGWRRRDAPGFQILV
ncbi:MAG: hypothetical protein DMF26_11550 [Verrucomicrobia bacterium]|nr:MAG: hypothetical protein DMF26_11550 [Verrucomicrobiota bacterium]